MLLAVLLAVPATAAGGLSCLNDEGKAVDFFYAFKYPAGYSYAYMDESSKLAASSSTLDDKSSCVTRTLSLASTKTGHVMWNDQHPDGSQFHPPYGHMKGAIIFNAQGGIWLTHSLPQFPATGKDFFADASDKYGQSFLCVTVGASEIKAIAQAMVVQRPSVYDAHVQGALATAFPDVVDWATKGTHNDDPSTTVTISSRGGKSFTLFGTSAKFDDDIYADLVAPVTGSLEMEGWRNGVGNLDASCKAGHQVKDVLGVHMLDKTWKTSQDHSKWAVSKTHFCVGDKNRQQAQFKRGGGLVCIKEASIVSQMQKVVAKTDSCRDDEALVV